MLCVDCCWSHRAPLQPGAHSQSSLPTGMHRPCPEQFALLHDSTLARKAFVCGPVEVSVSATSPSDGRTLSRSIQKRLAAAPAEYGTSIIAWIIASETCFDPLLAKGAVLSW